MPWPEVLGHNFRLLSSGGFCYGAFAERRSATGRRHYGESQRLGDATPRQRHTDAARGHARMPYRLGPSHAGLLFEFASNAEARGCKVIIAGAGGAAHLPGMAAAKTTLPVLGVPVQSRALQGVDSLLYRPDARGVPVGTLAIGEAGAVNAALLAAAILALEDAELRQRLKDFANARRAGTGGALVSTLLPGSTIAVLGGGQLGRMLAFEARRMGYSVGVLDPDGKGPAAQVADLLIPAAFDDARAALELAARADVVTVETELIPYHLLEQLEALKPVRPSSMVLRTIQDKATQRLSGPTASPCHRMPRSLTRPALPERQARSVSQLCSSAAAVATMAKARWWSNGRLNWPAPGTAWTVIGPSLKRLSPLTKKFRSF